MQRSYRAGLLYYIATLLVFYAASTGLLASERPNVVFIICDDLNDFTSVNGGHPQAITPNMARFAETAVSFEHAYSNNPVCAPSRASLFTGIYPHTSKNLFWAKWYENPILKHSKTMMEFFRENGYRVVGTGKNEHHHRASDWDFYKSKADYGPYWSKGGKDRSANPWVPEPMASVGPIDGSFGPLRMDHEGQPEAAGWKYGWGKERLLDFSNPETRDLTPDELNAQWAAKTLRDHANNPSGQPLFMAVGFVRPHTPLHVPQEYFDLFPEDELQRSTRKANDADDTYLNIADPSDGKGRDKGYYYYKLLEESYGSAEAGVKQFLRAYLASVAAVDDCIGTVIDAVEQNGLAHNTIIVVTSDHGWDMGQKKYLFKNTLWEDSTRIPMLIRAPGISVAGTQTRQPVSLIDLYPTLVDLCDLEGDTRKSSQGTPLDGFSMRPLLEDPQAGEWAGPDGALTMRFAGPKNNYVPAMQHWAYRTERYRYIHYNNGKEELYDHHNDPNEWTNLASKPEYKALKAQYKEAIFSQLPGKAESARIAQSLQAKHANTWKASYLKKHPEADANRDGVLSWPELNAHQKSK
jgi:iduronate 2-sulfatase